jgi:hypothetical protein
MRARRALGSYTGNAMNQHTRIIIADENVLNPQQLTSTCNESSAIPNGGSTEIKGKEESARTGEKKESAQERMLECKCVGSARKKGRAEMQLCKESV